MKNRNEKINFLKSLSKGVTDLSFLLPQKVLIHWREDKERFTIDGKEVTESVFKKHLSYSNILFIEVVYEQDANDGNITDPEYQLIN